MQRGKSEPSAATPVEGKLELTIGYEQIAPGIYSNLRNGPAGKVRYLPGELDCPKFVFPPAHYKRHGISEERARRLALADALRHKDFIEALATVARIYPIETSAKVYRRGDGFALTIEMPSLDTPARGSKFEHIYARITEAEARRLRSERIEKTARLKEIPGLENLLSGEIDNEAMWRRHGGLEKSAHFHSPLLLHGERLPAYWKWPRVVLTLAQKERLLLRHAKAK